ncbi:MAG: PilZ domain-containing protein [Chromatiales bacterium]|nr:PilZ domain-containing protein [Chromatiales bacterium]
MNYMDHRCGVRHPLRLLARLHVPGRVPLLAQARDASLGGVFLEVRPSRLPMRALLHVELLPHGDAPPVRLAAMIVRKTTEGVALMFDDFAPRPLSRLLRVESYNRDLSGAHRWKPVPHHHYRKGGH